jgi:hypothetical protein
VYSLVPIGPAIGVQPSSIEVSIPYQQNPGDEILTLTNAGEGTLNYSIASQAAWVSVLPNAGTLNSGASTPLTVSFDAETLPIGDHEALLIITDPNAANSPAVITVTLHVITAAADLDLDGDVDQSDFGLFQACYSGAGIAQNDPNCEKARLDGDNDVDATDFAIFQDCLSGAGVLADPDCGA